jgi:hypothetical protein
MAFSIILEDTKPILYNKFKQMEKEVTIKEKEIQKQKQDILDNFRNTILGNLKKENVLVLNEVKDNFNLAHFNKKDFPNIFNSVQFEGDEFQYQKEKPMLNKIRNQKYLLIQQMHAMIISLNTILKQKVMISPTISPLPKADYHLA